MNDVHAWDPFKNPKMDISIVDAQRTIYYFFLRKNQNL